MIKGKDYYKDFFILCLIIAPFINISKIINNESIVHILQIFSVFVLTIILLKHKDDIKANKVIISLLLFSIYQFFISFINDTLSYGILFSIYFLFISSIFIINSFAKNDYKIIHVLYFLYSLLIIINFPSVIKSLSLSEYHKMFLLGGKNSLTIIAISSIFYNYIYNYIYHKKMTKVGYILLSINLLTLLLSGSSTGIIVGILIAVFIVLGVNINVKPKIYVIIYLVIFILIQNTECIKGIPILYDFITNKLNKDLTFTGRTYIWENAISYIKQNFFGYGRGNNIIFSFTNSTNECHNAFLELLLAGGIPSLVLFINFLYNSLKVKNFLYNKKIVSISRFVVFSIFVIGLTESIINNNNLWWIIIITYCVSVYLGKDVKNDNNIYTNI